MMDANRDILIMSHQWLVEHLVRKRKYRHPGIPREDLVQEGMLGLCEAAQKYKPQLALFSTHAYYVIWGRLTRYFRVEVYHLGVVDPGPRDGGRWYLTRCADERNVAANDTLLHSVQDQSPGPEERVIGNRARELFAGAMRQASRRIAAESRSALTRAAAANRLSGVPRRVAASRSGVSQEVYMKADSAIIKLAVSLIQ